MKYVIDHDYHIHSYLSSCSRHPEQTKENILKYAKRCAYRSICMTDHFWDSKIDGASNWYMEQNFEHIAKSLPLPEDDEVKFLFGCECDMRADRTLGLAKETADSFDFIIVPTTHLHMKGFTVSQDGSESSFERAKLWVTRLSALLEMDLPFSKIGIAHLACTLIDPRSNKDFLKTISLIDTKDMHDLFCVCKDKGVGIELNASDMTNAIRYPDEIFRIFRAAKDAGCKFYLGSDSHLPEEFENIPSVFDYAVTSLSLTEEDKFRIGNI